MSGRVKALPFLAAMPFSCPHPIHASADAPGRFAARALEQNAHFSHGLPEDRRRAEHERGETNARTQRRGCR